MRVGGTERLVNPGGDTRRMNKDSRGEGWAWHASEVAEVLQTLGTDADSGLGDEEAARRLEELGPNELEDRGTMSPWAILWDQFTSTMIAILIVAALASALLGDYEDSIAIAVIVVLNAALGFVQEYRAERAMAALKRLAAPRVKVRREGHAREISARELVPGDVVLLEAGNLVPADGRLVEGANLRVQEAALTGESEPVGKDTAALEEVDAPLGERAGMVYLSTVVAMGRGLFVVTETGMATELGKIAAMIQTAGPEQTPLQRRLNEVGKVLALAALAIVGVVFALGLLRGEDLEIMFLTAVSLAVAAVPEGLPAVVTISLALGAQRMLRRHALIRKLPAVETLGSVTLLLAGGTLCNDALLEEDEDDGFRAIGDPTEGALVVAAAREGMKKSELEASLPRVREVPFDSRRKRMTTVHEVASPSGSETWENVISNGGGDSAPYVAFTKGAVDSLLDISSHVWSGDGRVEALGEEWRERISAANERLAGGGVRVLGVGLRRLQGLDGPGDELERDLTFVGMVGMIDPPRPEAKDAVETCKRAGIRPVMITGDHPLTAGYIATELGIVEDRRILVGRDLANTSGDELKGLVEEEPVYARVSPENKLSIVAALQEKGHIVAMTGDGVNDAPALKKADIGVAMGITGTDVSKEAADMVLTDDNFATIVAAVEQGRVIYDNIQKFLRFLLSSNIGEVLTVFLGVVLAGVIGLTAGGEGGLVLPLLATQILWINLITDGAPALALGLDPADPEVMNRPPRPRGSGVITRRMWGGIAFVGIIMAVGTLLVLDYGLPGGLIQGSGDLPYARTMAFTTLVLFQLFNAPNARSDERSAFHRLFRNPWLRGALVLSLALQILVVYTPFLQPAFGTVSLNLGDWLVCVAGASSVLWLRELRKLFVSQR